MRRAVHKTMLPPLPIMKTTCSFSGFLDETIYHIELEYFFPFNSIKKSFVRRKNIHAKRSVFSVFDRIPLECNVKNA